MALTKSSITVKQRIKNFMTSVNSDLSPIGEIYEAKDFDTKMIAFGIRLKDAKYFEADAITINEEGIYKIRQISEIWFGEGVMFNNTCSKFFIECWFKDENQN